MGTNMSIEWGTWTPFEGSPGRPLAEVDRATADRYFEQLMTAREARTSALKRLLAQNGVQIDIDDPGLQRLDDWYRSVVSPSRSEPGRLDDRWYAVGLDVGLYLGDVIIARAPRVEWRVFTKGRSDASYHRPVLMGFRGVKNSLYNVDPERLVGIHGHRLVAGDDQPEDHFVQLVGGAVAKA